jgi:hypothetical protein
MERDALARAIQRLDVDDLRMLNQLIVERLKLLDQAHSTVMLAQFHLGDRVSFTPHGRERKTGIITRLNKKTATLITDDQQQWNVSPHLLQPVRHIEVEPRDDHPPRRQ